MVRYSPNAFKYNDRVALALLPSLVILGSYAGKLVSGILLAGAMFTYIMDTLRWREAAFASVWITLVAANIGFIVSVVFQRDSSLLMLFGSMGLNGPTMLLTGLWGSLQFKWMLIQHPQLVLPCERLLLAAAVPVAMAIQSWGLTEAIGMDLVPFPAVAIGCVLYTICMQPLPSSFQKSMRGPGYGGEEAAQLQGRFEGFVASAAVCLFPPLLYGVTHLEVIFKPQHFWSLQLLWSVPTLFIALLPRGLWWMADNALTLQYVRGLAVVVAGSAAVLGFEGRVVFHSFGTYIPLSFPYNWMAVSTFLFLKAGLIAAHFAGMLKTQVGFSIASCFLVLSSCAGGIAAGLPPLMMVAPLMGSAGFALFYDSGLLRDYLMFFVGTIAALCWLLWHHFWFLEIYVGGMALHTVCQLIGIGAVVAFLVPGMLLTDTFGRGTTRRILETLLLAQAACLTLLEERLFAGQTDEASVLYPAYLVLFTSLLGTWLCRRLVLRTFISAPVGWILQCLYLSKLPMLLLPQANLVLPSFLLILAVTPPVLLFKPEKERLPVFQGGLILTCILLAVLAARMAIFDVVQAVISSHPSEGLLMGTLVMVATAGAFPLYYRFYARASAARRYFALAVAFGSLLCFLRPPLPIKGGAACPELPAGLCPRLWDKRHVPDHEVDDLEMYGMGWTRREHWPMWLVIAAVMTGLAAVTSSTPVQKSIRSRVLWGLLGGICVGSYLGLEFFAQQDVLQMLCVASSVLACGFLVFVRRPSGTGDFWMPLLIVSWAVLFPLMFILQAELPMPPVPPDMRRLFPDAPQLMERDRESAGRAAVLAIYAAQSLLIAFALKLKVSQVLRSGSGPVVGPSGSSWDARTHSYTGHLASASPSLRAFCSPGGLGAMFSTMVPPRTFSRLAGRMKMTGAGALMLRRLSAEGLGWAPTTGNVVTMFSFCLCLALNGYFTNGKDIGIFVVVPILLLLSQDPLLFRDLAEKRRYFPVMTALVSCLWWAALGQISQKAMEPGIPGLDSGAFRIWAIMRDFISLVASVPSLVVFLRFLWIHDQLGSVLLPLSLLPLNLVPFLLSDISFLLDLGGLGLVGSVILAGIYSYLRTAGQRLV